MLLCTAAYAEPENDPGVEAEQSEAEWIPSGPQNSLLLSYGVMGYFNGDVGGGPVLDLAYYWQTGDLFREGVSLRWFHDNEHHSHYIGQVDSEHRCTQIEMLSLAYHIQGFKRYGGWEFSIDGGFGLGVAFSEQHGKREPAHVAYKGDEPLEGGADAMWILWGIYGDDWDFFFDASLGGTIEYVIGDFLSLGVNTTIHLHTMIYFDISLSAQMKVLF